MYLISLLILSLLYIINYARFSCYAGLICFSCCVDEIAAQHIGGDAIIHFGHSCLTSSPQVPVLNIFRKRKMDFSALKSLVSEINGSVIVIYDIGYHHLLGNVTNISNLF